MCHISPANDPFICWKKKCNFLRRFHHSCRSVITPIFHYENTKCDGFYFTSFCPLRARERNVFFFQITIWSLQTCSNIFAMAIRRIMLRTSWKTLLHSHFHRNEWKICIFFIKIVMAVVHAYHLNAVLVVSNFECLLKLSKTEMGRKIN